jgi:membrane-bound ClpP family serine protease
MNVVEKNFVIYRWVELALLVVGLVCMFAFTQHPFIKGVGIGLFIQSALMLSLDFFAEKRGEEYLSYLLTL